MAADVGTRTAIDDIFDDNFSEFEDDPFADKPSLNNTRDDKAVLSPRSSLKRKANNFDDKENLGLGLDEEVKIVKKRQPVAKLDEARLLSQPGLPVLRKLIRDKQITRKLRLKGKGHEFTDAARLLNYYQLWLDNLYPRAKFADALQLVEKAGHTKRMQMMRCEWINEGKPGYIRPEATTIDVEVRQDEMPDLFNANNSNEKESTNETSQAADETAHQSIFGNGLKDDSLFIPDGQTDNNHDGNDDIGAGDNGPDEDELDALLAMQDDYELPKQPAQPSGNAEDFEGEDDLDALLAEQEAEQTALDDIRLGLNSDADYRDIVPDLDVDDLDALLASQESREDQSKRQNSKIDSQHSIPADLDDEDATITLPVTRKDNQVGVEPTESNVAPNVVVEGEDSQLNEADASTP